MEKLRQLLENEGDNYILPFFWMHGEAHEVIRREMAAVAECGIRAVCVESRPHPDFCGPRWWADLDVVMDEARRRGMRVWVLDDDKFPTGHAGGAFAKEHPQLAKLYLAQRHMDLIGPARDAAVLVGPFLPPDARLLAVLACPRPDLDSTTISAEGIIDVTHTLQDGFVRVNLPAGAYRLFVLFTTRTGGGRADYINLIDAQSVRVLIDAVYEPHYARYKDDFGKTFAGFFSDEPEFGNTPGYDFNELPGTKPDMKLPWSDALEASLREAWGAGFAKRLPALWYGMDTGAAAARGQYMDAATRLVQTCFSDQLGGWCAQRGVAYIGHIIEDDNAHARLGCSIGHYFRGLHGQHMAGIDVVHHQIQPGFTGKIHRWVGWETDGEFFHFALARLGASAAKLDAHKRGRALCEIFGNFGWAEGVGLMKWLCDHMLVRGINHFVPHAFSPTFPDKDCPPHFYANGRNPQFKAFAALMRYLNRLSHLLYGGKEHTDAAVLYHAEAEWSGEAMLVQKPLRALMEDQLCADVLPADALINGARMENGRLLAGGGAYTSLVVPACAHLPAGLAAFLMQAAKEGLQVLFVNSRPAQDTLETPLPSGFDACGLVLTLDALAARVRAYGQPAAQFAGPNKDLRFACTRQGEDTVLMFFNESVDTPVDTRVRLAKSGKSLIWYDAANNLAAAQPLEGGIFALKLAPGEAAVAVVCADAPAGIPALPLPAAAQALNGGWEIAVAAEGETDYTPFAALAPGAPLPNLNGAGESQSFVGTARYQTTFAAHAGTPAVLHLPQISDAAFVALNGRHAGVVLGGSGRLSVGHLLVEGENTLTVEIASTLVWRLKDPVSVFMQIPPTGLLQPPVLELA